MHANCQGLGGGQKRAERAFRPFRRRHLPVSRRSSMAAPALEVKLFGKWSFEDVEVRACIPHFIAKQLGSTPRPHSRACEATVPPSDGW